MDKKITFFFSSLSSKSHLYQGLEELQIQSNPEMPNKKTNLNFASDQIMGRKLSGGRDLESVIAFLITLFLLVWEEWNPGPGI